MPDTGFELGDLVLTPDGELREVVNFPNDGRIATSSPWEGHWVRYKPEELRKASDA